MTAEHYPRRPSAERRRELDEWLTEATPAGRALAAEFPVGTLIYAMTNSVIRWYVVGYVDGIDVLRVAINGWPDDPGAEATMIGPLCADHVRNGALRAERLQ